MEKDESENLQYTELFNNNVAARKIINTYTHKHIKVKQQRMMFLEISSATGEKYKTNSAVENKPKFCPKSQR